MDERKLAQVLRKDPSLLRFLEEGLNAFYNKRSRRIEYTSPGSSAEMGRGMDYYNGEYPEVFSIMECVTDDDTFFFQPIRKLTEQEIKERVALSDLVKEYTEGS